jgi:hypothetical protein
VLEVRAEAKAERVHHTLHVEKVGYRPDLARALPLRLGDAGWEFGGSGKASR